MADKRKRRSADNARDLIAKVATELFIRHGFKGTSYDMIAKKVGVTTTNIHYHFGSKGALITEVLDSYVKSTIDTHSSIWSAENAKLIDKIEAVREFNRLRFRAFNKGKTGGRPWSLIGRMRLEAEALPDEANKSLVHFATELSAMVARAVAIAVQNGELISSAPQQEISQLLIGIVYGSALFTQMTGDFDGLENMYSAFWVVVSKSYAA